MDFVDELRAHQLRAEAELLETQAKRLRQQADELDASLPQLGQPFPLDAGAAAGNSEATVPEATAAQAQTGPQLSDLVQNWLSCSCRASRFLHDYSDPTDKAYLYSASWIYFIAAVELSAALGNPLDALAEAKKSRFPSLPGPVGECLGSLERILSGDPLRPKSAGPFKWPEHTYADFVPDGLNHRSRRSSERSS